MGGVVQLTVWVTGLREHSPRFAALWAAGTVTEHDADTEVLRHPVVGELRLDCDVLVVPANDPHVVAYSATPAHRPGCQLLLPTVLALA